VGTAPNDRIIESFSIFKEGIAPEWEDAANKYGGEWNLRKSGRQGSPDDVDEWWANLVLGLVGETIDIGECHMRLKSAPGASDARPVAGLRFRSAVGRVSPFCASTSLIGDHITGARVVDKSNGKGAHPVYRVELWLRTKDDAVKETIKKRLIDVMTEGRGAKNLGEQFQWKLHGV
jgi:translation initiation factor 4E